MFICTSAFRDSRKRTVTFICQFSEHSISQRPHTQPHSKSFLGKHLPIGNFLCVGLALEVCAHTAGVTKVTTKRTLCWGDTTKGHCEGKKTVTDTLLRGHLEEGTMLVDIHKGALYWEDIFKETLCWGDSSKGTLCLGTPVKGTLLGKLLKGVTLLGRHLEEGTLLGQHYEGDTQLNGQ